MGGIDDRNRGLGHVARGLVTRPRPQVRPEYFPAAVSGYLDGYRPESTPPVPGLAEVHAGFVKILLLTEQAMAAEETRMRHDPRNVKTIYVPIDKTLTATKETKKALTLRFFKAALSESHIRLTPSALEDLYRDANYGVKGMTDWELRVVLDAHLMADEPQIAFSGQDFLFLQRRYRIWIRKRTREIKEARKWAQRQRERSVGFVFDFYRAHWNGLVGVVEGFAEIPMLVPNIVGKVRGKNWTHPRFNFARADYQSDWGKRNGAVMEMGASLGLTGPVVAIAKSPAMVSALGRAQAALGLGPKSMLALKTMIVGTEVGDMTQTALEVREVLEILITGEIMVDGKPVPITARRRAELEEQLLLLGAGLIVSSAIARGTHDTVDALGGKPRKPRQRIGDVLERQAAFDNVSRASGPGPRTNASDGPDVPSRSDEAPPSPNRRGTPERFDINKLPQETRNLMRARGVASLYRRYGTKLETDHATVEAVAKELNTIQREGGQVTKGRGAGGEIGVLEMLFRHPDVSKIRMIASGKGGKSPDYQALIGDLEIDVEVRTITLAKWNARSGKRGEVATPETTKSKLAKRPDNYQPFETSAVVSGVERKFDKNQVTDGVIAIYVPSVRGVSGLSPAERAVITEKVKNSDTVREVWMISNRNGGGRAVERIDDAPGDLGFAPRMRD